jgi:hypothetical protein
MRRSASLERHLCSARKSHGSSRIFTDADGLKSVFNLWKSVAEQRFPFSRGQAGEQRKIQPHKKSLNDYAHHLRIRPEKLASFVTVFTIDDKLARLSHTLAAHLANHLVASDSSSRTISPWICLGRPHPLATKALRNLNHPSMR